ncbi:MAG: hypothetical protein JWN38_1187 [Candidatus Saccharibacteria bacterium]|nr:hypothetical protein [Candidatus Saccharibacteria bacterium]
MTPESAEPAKDHEIEMLLEDSLVAGIAQETTTVEWDLGNVACQWAVLDALTLEGVDVGDFTYTLNKNPGMSIGDITDGYRPALEIINNTTSMPEHSKMYWTSYFEAQHRIARVIQEVIWARRNIDDGADPSEVKIVTQLELYTDEALPSEEKLVWLKVVDRIIPEVDGLGPTSPDTALEIENWIKGKQT